MYICKIGNRLIQTLKKLNKTLKVQNIEKTWEFSVTAQQ